MGFRQDLSSAGSPWQVSGRPWPYSSDAGPLVDVEITGALVVAAVEVVGLRNARFGRSLWKASKHRPTDARFLDPPFAACAVHVVGAAVMVSDF